MSFKVTYNIDTYTETVRLKKKTQIHVPSIEMNCGCIAPFISMLVKRFASLWFSYLKGGINGETKKCALKEQ